MEVCMFEKNQLLAWKVKVPMKEKTEEEVIFLRSVLKSCSKLIK
jgi:hypothetical protein